MKCFLKGICMKYIPMTSRKEPLELRQEQYLPVLTSRNLPRRAWLCLVCRPVFQYTRIGYMHRVRRNVNGTSRGIHY
jgi:hypothetical protein